MSFPSQRILCYALHKDTQPRTGIFLWSWIKDSPPHSLSNFYTRLKGKRAARAKIISSQAGGCSTPLCMHTLQKNTRGLVRSNKRTCACHLPATQHSSTKPQRHPELVILSSMSESLETTPGDRFHPETATAPASLTSPRLPMLSPSPQPQAPLAP